MRVKVRLTSRDDEMLDWLTEVRMADMESVRFALAAMAGSDEPVTKRRAQQWVNRLEEVGLAARGRVTYRDGSIVWPTSQVSGQPAPNLFRQTTRHEIAVAAVSARYLFHGYSWQRDRKPLGMLDHQADGVAVKGELKELIEVELTPKTVRRYKLICDDHAQRMMNEGVTRVVYLCTNSAARTVSREADRYIFRTLRPQLVSLGVFDARGRWAGDDDRLWQGLRGLTPTAPSELDGFKVLEQAAL